MSDAADERKDAIARRVFFALLAVLSALAYVPVVRAGSLNALGGFALPLLMWAPGLAAIVTSLIVFRSLRPCGFAIRRRTLPWLLACVAIPIAYTALIYLPLRALGVVSLGGPHLTAAFLGIGFLQSLLFASGEEIGWRGFLAPLMAKRYGFLRGNLLLGAVWSLYHVPAILFAGYGQSADRAFGLSMFTLAVTGLGLFLAWARKGSDSLWPAAVFHATHNLIFLHVFDPIRKTSSAAAWLIGEQGVALCVTLVGLGAIAIVRQGGLRLRDRRQEPRWPIVTEA